MLLNACKLERENNVSMILLLIEDITERKQFETERERLLTQEQLARQQAETANKAKDEFLSNLSHELRNPLNTMLGWSQLLRKKSFDKAMASRALEVIERSAQAQAQLIEDLLDVSRITSGKLNLNIQTHDLGLIVQAALDIVQLSASAKNIQIVSSLNPVTIVGDADRLQQVLWNLLSNAIKFTPPGGQVEITLKEVGQQAQIQVSDTGQGIEADLLPYIFDRFRQGDSSTTKAVAGLGLGLSIVRHLVELHGGTVQAESPGVGQGATLTVYLPLPTTLLQKALALQESTPEGNLELSSNAEQDNVLSLAGLRILAVDDEIDTLDLLKFALENYGAEILTVTSVAEALTALTRNPNQYDLLLSDIGMPSEDGYFLIQQVRSLDAESGGQIPAIALTAYASEQDRQKAIEAGFQAHITKPVEPVQLALLIRNLIAD
jgi:two-component system CheB/CheR fusion protein